MRPRIPRVRAEWLAQFADCAWTDADELIRLVYCAVLIRRAGPGRAGAVGGELVIVLVQARSVSRRITYADLSGLDPK